MAADEEWISGAECWRRYKRRGPWLKTHNVPQRIDDTTGLLLYELARIQEAIDGEPPAAPPVGPDEIANGIAGNVRAAEGLVKQVLLHHEKMFSAYDAANQAIAKATLQHLESQNAHIVKLEQQSLELRIVLESAVSRQHERQIAEKESERRGRIQEQAVQQIGQTLLPWLGPFLGKKLGVDAPAAAAAAVVGNSHAEQIGQFTIKLLGAMSDEQFAGICAAAPSEVTVALTAMRAAILKGEIK